MSMGLSGLYKNTKGAKEAEKRNKERERLIELLGESEFVFVNGSEIIDTEKNKESIADHLLANGVKVELPKNDVSMVDGHIETDTNVGCKKGGEMK